MLEQTTQSGLEVTIAAASAEGLAHSRGRGGTGAAQPGARVDRYLIVDELGRGAMGVVYAAYDPQLDRKVAIKVISVDALSGRGEAKEEAQARLLREAQAMARLLHPNVVAVHDVGSTDQDVFIAMEMVPGQTLRAWMTEQRRDEAAILRVFLAAGRGLAAAHAAGLVHRDFKPDNVLIDRDGAVKIADFGLARQIGASEAVAAGRTRSGAAVELTQTGAIVGTPAYMAPEQHLSLPADARSDQYAFCVALFEALYGERPFRGATLHELRAAVLAGRILPPADGPRWLLPILTRGLSVAPEARWPSMTALLDQLGRDPRRRRRRWLGAGALVIALGVTTAGLREADRSAAAAAMDACQAPLAAVSALWTPPRQDAVRAAFRAANVGSVEAQLSAVGAALESFVADWSALVDAGCTAHLVDRTLSPELKDLRDRCATRQLEEAAAIVDLLAVADDTVVEQSMNLVTSLPRPAQCEDLRVLARIAQESEQRVDAREEALRRRLYRVYAEANAGRFAQAQALVGPILAEVEALGARRLRGHVREVAARIHADLGQIEDSERLYLEALNDALATNSPALAAEIANQMIYLDGALLGRYAEALRWARIADGLITSVDDTPLRLQHLSYLGAIYGLSGDPAAGVAALDEALALADAGSYMGTHDRAAVVGNRANLLNAMGRRDEAIEGHQEAIDLLRSLLGDEHPDVANAISGIGQVHLLSGDTDAASERLREALALQEQLLGVEHPALATTLLNLAGAQLEAGDGVAAALSAARAAALIEPHLPEDHLYFGYIESLLGAIALRAEGDPATAKSRCTRGLELLEANLGPAHAHLTAPLTCLGGAALARRDPAAARGWLERALTLQESTMEAAVADRGYVRFALGLALAAEGDDARARALIEAARLELSRAGPVLAEQRDAATRWLERPRSAASAPARERR